MSKKRMDNILIICTYLLLFLIVLTILLTFYFISFGEVNVKKVKTIEKYYGNDFCEFFSRNKLEKSDEYNSIFTIKF